MNKMSGGNPSNHWKTATATAASETFTTIRLSRAITECSPADQNARTITRRLIRGADGIVLVLVAFRRGQCFRAGRQNLLEPVKSGTELSASSDVQPADTACMHTT
jgi:hypothetical protein